jgi:hypothetical protein
MEEADLLLCLDVEEQVISHQVSSVSPFANKELGKPQAAISHREEPLVAEKEIICPNGDGFGGSSGIKRARRDAVNDISKEPLLMPPPRKKIKTVNTYGLGSEIGFPESDNDTLMRDYLEKLAQDIEDVSTSSVLGHPATPPRRIRVLNDHQSLSPSENKIPEPSRLPRGSCKQRPSLFEIYEDATETEVSLLHSSPLPYTSAADNKENLSNGNEQADTVVEEGNAPQLWLSHSGSNLNSRPQERLGVLRDLQAVEFPQTEHNMGDVNYYATN